MGVTIKGRQNNTSNNQNNLRGVTVDLSEKGAGLALNNFLPLSSIVDIHIDASPGYQPFRIEAETLWNKTPLEAGMAFRAGLRFLKESAQMQVEVDRRFSPKTAANLSIKLFPNDITGNVINISEAGICFGCKRPVLPNDLMKLRKPPTRVLCKEKRYG